MSITVGRYIPIYDAWSNEGGGREIEEGIRFSERAMLEEIRPRALAGIERLNKRDMRYAAELKAAEDSFVARYGADALANKGALLKRGTDDAITMSNEAKSMIVELANLERKRIETERVTWLNEKFRNMLQTELEGAEASVIARQNSYDARFEKDDNLRADAYERVQVARDRLENLAARNQEWNAASARRAGEVAASMSSSRALFASTKLFEFERNGAIKIDAKALANMGTTEAATAELARLIGVLTERNGLGQLRDALVGALNGQNRRIAELTGAIG